MSEERRFPIMTLAYTRKHGPLGYVPDSVPWSRIAHLEQQAHANHGQTLSRLASRGGLSPDEMWCVYNGMRWGTNVAPAEAVALLRTLNEPDELDRLRETASVAADYVAALDALREIRSPNEGDYAPAVRALSNAEARLRAALASA